ncbi:DUF6538 domain-containing protein [Methylobacterium haplocladii]|uniref:DUF6538 domain-containing protein n=1 Tax=Methylobacterium haplocladii TaxID=1176176 RepID=UPI0034D1F4E8
MILPASRPWRHPRSGVFWFRRREPKELLFLVGRTEERKSLRTKEPTIARSRWLLAAVEVDERWSLLQCVVGTLAAPRCRVASAPPPPPPDASAPSVPSKPKRATFTAYAREAALAPSTVKCWTGVLVALEDAVGADDLAARHPRRPRGLEGRPARSRARSGTRS